MRCRMCSVSSGDKAPTTRDMTILFQLIEFLFNGFHNRHSGGFQAPQPFSLLDVAQVQGIAHDIMQPVESTIAFAIRSVDPPLGFGVK